MHNVPTANALTQRVGVPVAPVEVGRYFVGEIVKEKRSIKSVGRSYMAGNLHRPAYVELDVTFKISGLTYTRRAALKLGRPQDHETGAKVFVYVNTIVVPHIQSAREAILLRGQGNSPDAVITALGDVEGKRWWVTDTSHKESMSTHIEAYKRQRARSSSRSPARGSPSRTGGAA